MNRRLIRTIENDYPYPIASEFRILNTEEYLEIDEFRLKQILRTVETTAHFIALISIIDLEDKFSKKQFELPDTFSKEFPGRFTRTSFGKWVAMIRDITKIFKTNKVPMFVEEFVDYFIKGKHSETEVLKAFNKVTTIRNKIAHLDSTPTKKDIQNFCEEDEECLETILTEMDFIADYPFLYVSNVNVVYLKWTEPSYNHAFSEIIGNTSKFRAYKKKLKGLINTPAVIITKDKEDEYLNLDPLIVGYPRKVGQLSDTFKSV